MSINSKMTAINDEIRSLLGITGNMGLDAMATNLETANDEVDTQAALIAQIATAMGGKAQGTGGTSGGTSGGLPSGVSALAFGTISPTSDASSVNITHGLGTKPNFYLFAEVNANYTSSVGTSCVVAGAGIDIEMKSNSSATTTLESIYMTRGYGSSGSAGGTTNGTSSLFNATTCTLYSTSTYKFKSGKTYAWLCGVLDF